MKFKTAFNALEFPKYRESKFQVSQTVPDMSMSIKEIMDRFARGLAIDGEKVAMYHGEDMPPDIKKMDLSEVEDLRESVAEDIIRQKQELHNMEQKLLEDKNYERFLQTYKADQDAIEKETKLKIAKDKANEKND